MAIKDQISVIKVDSFKVSHSKSDVLGCYGIGAGLAVIAHNKESNVCAVVHYSLPKTSRENDEHEKFRFGNTALMALLNEFDERKIKRSEVDVYAVGGARVNSNSHGDYFDVGRRNITVFKEFIRKYKLQCKDSYFGGEASRSFYFKLSDGTIIVKSKGALIEGISK